MTNEEAIARIKDHMSVHKIYEERAVKITEALNMAIKALEQPEIIRCKDCKHRDPEDRKCDCGHDIVWQLQRDDNWFCGDAERSSNGQN